jgi:hypothetical protein
VERHCFHGCQMNSGRCRGQITSIRGSGQHCCVRLAKNLSRSGSRYRTFRPIRKNGSSPLSRCHLSVWCAALVPGLGMRRNIAASSSVRTSGAGRGGWVESQCSAKVRTTVAGGPSEARGPERQPGRYGRGRHIHAPLPNRRTDMPEFWCPVMLARYHRGRAGEHSALRFARRFGCGESVVIWAYGGKNPRQTREKRACDTLLGRLMVTSCSTRSYRKTQNKAPRFALTSLVTSYSR